MGHSFDMLTFDFLLKPPQPFTGLFFFLNHHADHRWSANAFRTISLFVGQVIVDWKDGLNQRKSSVPWLRNCRKKRAASVCCFEFSSLFRV